MHCVTGVLASISDQREAVDQQHQVGTALGGAGAVDELLGDDVLVLLEVVEVDQPDRDVLVVVRRRAWSARRAARRSSPRWP